MDFYLRGPNNPFKSKEKGHNGKGKTYIWQGEIRNEQALVGWIENDIVRTINNCATERK
jgi:hypothetical protein